MKLYKYKAISMDGAPVEGLIDAKDRVEAIEQIRNNCSVILSLSENHGINLRELDINAKIDEKTLALMCSQFAIILQSGLQVIRCVELVEQQLTDKTLKRMLKRVAEDLQSGDRFSDSMELRSEGKLPSTFIETIRAGEEIGDLETAFHKLSRFYERSSQTKQKVRSALTYPTILCVMAVLVLFVILLVAVPAFSKSFTSMGLELPGVTRLMISMSTFVREYWGLLAGIIIVLFLFCRIWKTRESGRRFFSRLALAIPIIGPINLMSASAQFANTMSSMLGAGIDMLRAIQITSAAIGNHVISQEVFSTAKGVESGRRLGDCMRDCETLPELLCEMTAIGEESGSVEDTLDVTARYYENEVSVRTAKALSLLEPAIIVFPALIVVLLLLSVYLPLFGMYGGM